MNSLETKKKFRALAKSVLVRAGLIKIYPCHESYLKAERMIAEAENMIDVGCGPSPHPKAKFALDKFITPEHRTHGAGKSINTHEFELKGIKFIQSGIESMPFDDKTFDVVYSHHVLEHVNDPILACKELMRIGDKGIIFTPSAFSEIAFGREYHKWMVHAKNNTLIFIEKSPEEYMPFGSDAENPFDIALNEGGWYKFPIMIKNLRRRIRDYWYGHHPAVEVCFLWYNSFNVVVCWKDGTVGNFSANS